VNLQLATKMDWHKETGGGYGNLDLKNTGYERSPKGKKLGEQVDQICFGAMGGWPRAKDNVVGIVESDAAIKAHIKPFADKEFGGDAVKALAWWWGECIKMGQPAHKVEEKSFEFVLPYTHSYTQLLGRLTILDLPQRFPALCRVYKKLQERLPKAKPWWLLQIVHFLPGDKLGNPLPDENLVGSAGCLPYDRSVHMLGSMDGEFQFQPSLERALEDAKESCLNRGFFYVGQNKYPHPRWTWDQFAEYAENYMKQQEELL
jgi:hypothetical protein